MKPTFARDTNLSAPKRVRFVSSRGLAVAEPAVRLASPLLTTFPQVSVGGVTSA